MSEILLQWLNSFAVTSYLENKYIFSLFILLSSIILAKLLLFIFRNYLYKIAKKTKNNVDDLIFERTEKPLFYLVLVYGFRLAVLNLGYTGTVLKIINSAMALVFIFILSRSFDVIIETWGASFAKKTKTKIDEILLPLFQKATRIVFAIISLMWVLNIWNIDIGPYLAGVGISGLVLGLALQDSLKNVFGGINLLLDKTFILGDKVKLEDGTVGEVHDVGLRSTKIVTFDNEIIYVPNGYLANHRIQNYTHPNPKVRVNIDFGVVYGSSVRNVRKAVVEVLRKNKSILPNPAPRVDFLEMGDFSLKFKARFWVERWDMAYKTKLAMNESIYNALNKAKIEIPFPTQTIHLKKFK